MADERTMSYVTMVNSAQRNCQKVDTIVAMAQVNGYYKAEEPAKVRTGLSHPPTDTDSSYRPGGAAPILAPFSVSLIPSVFFEALMMMNATRTPTMMNLTMKM